LSERFVQAIRTDAIAPGGMKAIELNGEEIVVCNCSGTFHAIARRCGHMNAPLDLGTLDGSVVTCPLHCAQFDAATGAALSGPVPAHGGGETPPPGIAAMLRNVGTLMQHVRTESIATYQVKVESDWVWVALPSVLNATPDDFR
jgi:nitrite reductase/ring-hydroxylating ferredoxin subunit